MPPSRSGRPEAPGPDAFGDRKFQAVVHYIVWACAERLKLTMARLNRVLWLADGRAHAARGRPITSAVYVREGCGPAAAETQAARAALLREGLIEAVRDTALAGRREVLRSRVRPDPAALDAAELGYIEAAIDAVQQEVSAVANGAPAHAYAWEIARKGEVIPPHAILALRARDPSPRQIELARNAARELGLLL